MELKTLREMSFPWMTDPKCLGPLISRLSHMDHARKIFRKASSLTLHCNGGDPLERLLHPSWELAVCEVVESKRRELSTSRRREPSNQLEQLSAQVFLVN